MSFLFLTLHFSMKSQRVINQDPIGTFPLPFDPVKDPKIVGAIVVIHSVGEHPSGVYSVGVECSYQHRNSFSKPKFDFGERAKAYQVIDIEQLAIDDIQRVIRQREYNESQADLLSQVNANAN